MIAPPFGLVLAVMVALAAPALSAAPGVTALTANWASPQQTIDNFSASDSWCMQNIGLWADSNKTVVADLLFTTNFGIGLSAWRFNFGAGIDSIVVFVLYVGGVVGLFFVPT